MMLLMTHRADSWLLGSALHSCSVWVDVESDCGKYERESDTYL